MAQYEAQSRYERFRSDWLAFDARVRLLRPDARVGEGDIPWLPDDGDLAAMLSAWLQSVADGGDALQAELKLLRVAWHPDRFMLRCGGFLSDTDRARVLQRVVAVSQRINNALGALQR